MSYPEAGDSMEGRYESARRPERGFFRRIIFPALVVAAIGGVIWYLESTDDGPRSVTGERFGPVPLAAELRLPGLEIKPEEGSLAPNFLLERLDEGEVRLSDLRGQPVVLNFWATWCEPCRKEMPRFVEAYEKYRGQGLVILAVNLQEGKSPVRDFAEDYGLEFPIGIDRDGEVGDQYRLVGLPTTFFIGRDGVIDSVFTGPFIEKRRDTNVQSAIDDSELERRIAAILGPAGN
jgi:peroxiredoxin